MAKKASRPLLRVPDGYEVVRLLQQGRMGVVALIRQADSGELYVLKRLPEVLFGAAQSSPQSPAVVRFCREWNWMQTCKHPSVVRLLASGVDSSGPWVIMEYLSTGTLADWLRTNQKCTSLEHSLSWIVQVLSALHYLHHIPLPDAPESSQAGRTLVGLVHRDIKPSNLLFGDTSYNSIKVADFGLAKAYEWAGLSGVTASDAKGGTWKYVSRCQAADFLHAGPGVDVWAAIAVLFELLTGEVPRHFPQGLAGPSPMEIVVSCPPRFIRSIDAGILADIADLTDDVLQQDECCDHLEAKNIGERILAICHKQQIAVPPVAFA